MNVNTVRQKVMKSAVITPGGEAIVVGTQYLVTSCRVQLADGRERWVMLGKLRFKDKDVQAVADQWAQRNL